MANVIMQQGQYIPQTAGGPPSKKKIILFGLLIAAILAAMFGIYFVTSYSYVEVIVDSQSNEPVTYTLASQGESSAKETKNDNAPKTIKLMVSRGSHEVRVEQAGSTYFTVVKAGGFLSTKTVTAKVEAEKGRRFVGNIPEACMYMVRQVLISYDCESYDTRQVHMPATAIEPTYSQTNPDVTEANLKGYFKAKDGEFAVLGASEGHSEDEAGEDQTGPTYGAYAMKSDFDIADQPTRLSDLAGTEYSFTAFREGFLAYSTDYSKLFYYSAVGSKPEAGTIGRPHDSEGLDPYAIGVGGETVAVSYSKPLPQSIATNERGRAKEALEASRQDSKIVVRRNNQDKTYNFSKRYTTILPCGQEKLCLLVNKTMDVFDISGDKPKPLYSVNDVEEITNSGSKLIAVRRTGVIGLDVNSQQGSIQYTFGDYKFCGLRPDGDYYLLCVQNSRDNQSVLRIDQNAVSDEIDKKVAGLLDLKDIKLVSAYGQYIYISPDVGEVKYIPSLGGFGYDPERKASANAKIRERVEQIGFDRTKYRVTNTLE